MKIAGIVVGVVVVVLAIVYFTNPSIKAGYDEKMRQWSEWTPEKIQANPVGYLNFAKGELKKSEEKLKARLIAFRTQKAKFSDKAVKAEAKLRNYAAGLKEAKEKYVETKTTDSWPVVFKKQPMEEQDLKKFIVDANKVEKRIKTL